MSIGKAALHTYLYKLTKESLQSLLTSGSTYTSKYGIVGIQNQLESQDGADVKTSLRFPNKYLQTGGRCHNDPYIQSMVLSMKLSKYSDRKL